MNVAAITASKASRPQYPHTIHLVVGDWSGDGHEKSEDIIITSNLTHEEIQAAYKIGAEKIGIDATKDVAVEYEDNDLPEHLWRKYIDAGIADLGWVTDGKDKFRPKGGVDLDADGFADLYLLTVLRGNPEFKYTFPVRDEGETINIGGYGLFY